MFIGNQSLYAAYLELKKAGEAFGLRLFGARAVESMRMEKGFLHWKSDLLTEFDPFETGLERFVRLEKGDFVGRAALIKRRNEGPRKRLVSLVVEHAAAPARGGASVIQSGSVIGTVTSGDWGHRVGLNLAYAFIEPGFAALGSEVQIDLCGEIVGAKVIAPSPYDPAGARMRS